MFSQIPIPEFQIILPIKTIVCLFLSKNLICGIFVKGIFELIQKVGNKINHLEFGKNFYTVERGIA